jgi:phenol hydroxylase P0 protein
MPILDFVRPEASPLTCFVRLRERRSDGFVVFDFAMGDPELSVELILPEAAYDEFCQTHRVRWLSPAQCEQLDRDQLRWRYGEHRADPA